MKNISLSLNVILIVAVGVLYYYQFSEKPSPEQNDAEVLDEKIDMEEDEGSPENIINAKVAYINVDTLQEKYKLYSELINKLRARERKYDKELSSKSAAFEQKVIEFQKNASTMSQFEGQTRQKELAEEEQKLYKMRDDFAAKFQREEARLNEEFQKKVKGFIREANSEKGYNLIIGASQLGNVVLDYDEAINITNEIVIGLNKQYDEEQQEKE